MSVVIKKAEQQHFIKILKYQRIIITHVSRVNFIKLQREHGHSTCAVVQSSAFRTKKIKGGWGSNATIIIPSC